MNPSLVFTLVFLVFALVMGLLARKPVFRALNSALTVVALILTICSIVIYFDSQNLEQTLAGDKLFVLEQNGAVAAAFISGSGAAELVEDLTPLRPHFASQDWESLRDDKVLFVLHERTFASIDTVTIDKFTFQKSQLLDWISQADPRQAYADTIRVLAKVPANQPIELPGATTDEFKGWLFAAMTKEYLQKHTIAKALNAGDVQMAPTSITSWLITHVRYDYLKYLISVEEANA